MLKIFLRFNLTNFSKKNYNIKNYFIKQEIFDSKSNNENYNYF